MGRSNIIEVNRGEFISSISKLSDATGLTIKQMRTLLELLENDGMISRIKGHKWTHIRICNYDSYQGVGQDCSTKKESKPTNDGQLNGTIPAIDKNVNKGNNNDKNNDKNTPMLSTFPFEDFWNLYDKKRGKAEKIQGKWDSISPSIQQEILAYIPKYIKSQPDKKYRKDPGRFLDEESWKDELIESSPINSSNLSRVIQAYKSVENSLRSLRNEPQ